VTVNRRNYYRILQVQPEAPPEVIKASWRALMHAARAHPDLGGDPAGAAMINEAYAVLSDPERRRAYDAGLDLARLRGAGRGPAGADPAAARRGPAASAARASRPASPGQDPLGWRADTRCARCDAPLLPAPAPASSGGERELFGRRGARRTPRDEAAEVRVGSHGTALPARLVDLSTGGASLVLQSPVPVGAAIRIVLPTLDAVARVVACQRVGAHWRARAQWLTAAPLGSRGVYVRTTA
jgi:hypothetical protein